jgi:hypothetical protein
VPLLAAAATTAAAVTAAQQEQLLRWPSKSLQGLLHCIWAGHPGFSGLVRCCRTATKHAKAAAAQIHYAQLRPCALVQLLCKLPAGSGDALEAVVGSVAVECKAAWQWCILNLQLYLAQHAWQHAAYAGDGSLKQPLCEVRILLIPVQGLWHF